MTTLHAASLIPQPRDRTGFEIALICALKVEFDAVEALFDQYWDDNLYGKAENDPNAYTTGRIGNHNVVLAFMPGMGKTHSSSLAASLSASFTGVRLGLVVGICGGVPVNSEDEEIVLGDVILSTGLVQFDFGYQLSEGLVRKDTLADNLGRPSLEVRSLLAKLNGYRSKTQLEANVLKNLSQLYQKDGFERSKYPGVEKDKLYKATRRHKHHDLGQCKICEKCLEPTDSPCDDALELSCTQLGCEDEHLVPRTRLQEAQVSSANTSAHTNQQSSGGDSPRPIVHFGLIASGDQVMKSAQHRDDISRKENVLAFEMEGAGVWDTFPTIVIKGVSDYADSHKNKLWQRYAAATAAACMKAFLTEWRGTVSQSPQNQAQSQLPTFVAQLMSTRSKKPDALQLNLVDAIEKGDLETVKKQIVAGQNVSFQTDLGTPLGLAISNKNLSVVQTLLEAGADVEMRHKNGIKPLQLALNVGSAEITLMLLRQGVKLLDPTPIEIVVKAILLNSNELLNEALKHQPNLERPTRQRQYALYAAINMGNAATVRLLLDAGADPIGRDDKFITPLHCAMRSTENDNHVIAEELLKRNKKLVAASDWDGMTPLDHACRNQPPESVAVLLKYGAGADPDLQWLLDPAIRVGRVEIVKAFLEFGVDVNSPANRSRARPIQIVASLGNIHMADLLVSYGAEWQDAGLNILALSILHCQVEFVAWLVGIGVDVNARDFGDPRKPVPAISALTRSNATQKQRSSMLQCLLRHGANIDFHTPFADTVLCTAASRGDIELVKLLIANNASLSFVRTEQPNVSQEDLPNSIRPGMAPLHYAARAGKIDIIEILVSSGADVDAQNYFGKTAAHSVFLTDQSDASKLATIQKLSSLAAKLDTRTSRVYATNEEYSGVKQVSLGSTPAHIAARDYHALQTLGYLVANSQTINTQDEDGNTPLHIALERKPPRPYLIRGSSIPSDQLEVIRTLLKNGADLELQNAKGETAFYIAVKEANNSAMITLLDAGSEIEGATAKPTVLAMSAGSNDARVMETLLKRGVDIKSESGRLAFESACKIRNASIVSLMFEHGFSLEHQEPSFLPLHSAAKVPQNTQVIGILLKHGAAIHSVSETGRTALHEAAAKGINSNIAVLRQHGADKTLKDNDGNTPLDLLEILAGRKLHVRTSTLPH